MAATVILNPYSSRWRAAARRPEIEAALGAAGIAYRLVDTDRPRHAVDLAREAALRGDLPVIAAGGDGLIGEIVNGLLRAGSSGPLGILPLGTANDLAVALSLPLGLAAAAHTIAAGERRAIDIGLANGIAFANNSGVGLEPLVTLFNIRLTRVRGNARYALAALLAILQRPAWDVAMEWDGGSYEGSLALASIGNCFRTGGIFYMTPAAVPDDGLLDVTFSPALSRLRMLTLLPKAMKGTHIHEPEVRTFRTSRLRIRARPSTPVHVDGEIVDASAAEITYAVRPRALEVLAPRESSRPGGTAGTGGRA